IQIKTRARTFKRARSARATNAALTRQEGEPELAALFAAAHFSWEEPLSARSFAAWRSQLKDRVDDVTIRSHPSGGERVYELRTTTLASNLTDAQLMIRATDFLPVREILQFSEGEQVEISELPDEPAESVPAPSVLAFAPAAPRSKHEPIAERAAGAGDELRVISVLHRIGADLGEPIEVTRTNGRDVLVPGTGLAQARKDQIRELRATLPGVIVRFEQPLSPVPEKHAAPRIESRQQTAPLSVLRLRVQAHLGSQAALQKFTDEILDASE